MDVLLLSRLQFATTCFFHFLFVPLTLGLGVLIAIMETRYVRTGDEDYRRMARFWGRIFLTNFAIGVVTGITLEFQLGTNWSVYSAYVGDIFGSLLAIEATAAFFLESTFIAAWAFGWKRLGPKMHAFCIWVVVFASTMSAFWIICANAWMQHPVGYEIRYPKTVLESRPDLAGFSGIAKLMAEPDIIESRAEVKGLEGFVEIITQPTAIVMFFHTVMGAYVLAGFFVMGVSAWQIRKRGRSHVFQKSFGLAVKFTLLFAVLEIVAGHFSGIDVAEKQPAKLAAMESLWEGEAHAPLTLFLIPDPKNERNAVEIGKIPSVLSLLAFGRPEAEVKGLKDFPKDERPPVWPVFLSFRLMVGLGTLFPLIAFIGFLWREKLDKHPWFLRLLPFVIPLPYICILAGWTVTEMGRQPWIVHGLMRVSDAVSPIATSQALFSFVSFVVLYSVLGLIGFFLIARNARREPTE